MITTISTKFIDVEFSQLNAIATQLRIAGAAISVSKIGKLFRIFIRKNPQIATVEQILECSTLTPETETVTDQSNATLATSQAITTDEPQAIALEEVVIAPVQESTFELATLDELAALNITKLRKLGKAHHITGYTKMELEKLAEKLQGKVSKLEAL